MRAKSALTEADVKGPTRTVWDPLVRVFHWTLALAFFTAYFTGDEALALHIWSGYLIGGLVVLRLIWGFVGPKHARFADFVCGPITVYRYFFDLARFRARQAGSA